MDQMDDYDIGAVRRILANQATARCFPAGSPYLMPSERKTNSAGVVSGTVADSVPFGVITPPGGWPASAPNGYGGSDTTFTRYSRTCFISTVSTTGRCQTGTLLDLGSWRLFGGTAVSGISTSVRQAVESPFLWPYSPVNNPNSRGVISATSGPLYVSGTVRGRVTLRVAGRVSFVDRIRYANDPNDPEAAACADQLGIVASGDVLVVEGLMSRVRRVGRPDPVYPWQLISEFTALTGGATRFSLQGSFMSTGGTVGVENPGTTMGIGVLQPPCPDDGPTSSRSNGGCLAVTGGVAMRTYSPLYSSGTTGSGFRYAGTADRCQSTTRRPPFFPLTNRYSFVRTLDIQSNQANTPAKIRALLLRLKGKAL
jgi:hypothetical protein